MNLGPDPKFRKFDTNGDPLAGGKLYSYQAGTTTPQATYTDQGGLTPNANPVILDANGEANVWLDPTLSYKFTLHSASDVLQWTVDNVVGLLTADSVNTASIQDEAVTSDKILDGAITPPKLSVSGTANQILGKNNGNTAFEYKSVTVGQGLSLTHSTGGIAVAATPEVAFVKDLKATNVAGGTFTSGAWRTRDLNTLENLFSVSWIALSSNQFTLAAGSYEIDATAPAYATNAHQTKLRNITAGSDTILGQTAHAGATNGISSPSRLVGSFTIAVSTIFEIQHQATTTAATEGFGVASNFSVSTVYTQAKITRLR